MKNEKNKFSVCGTVVGKLMLGLAIFGLISPAPAKADDNKNSGKGESYEHADDNEPHPQRYKVSLKMKNGIARIKSSCHPGDKYYIEATTSLDNPKWERICADAVSKDGKIDYDDTCSPDHPARFYRLVWTHKKSVDDHDYQEEKDNDNNKDKDKHTGK